MPGIDDERYPEVGSRLHLLSLPYDVRYIIYSHLFPSLRQVYLMASKESINPMMRPGALSTGIFLTCRQLQTEASDYLFNNFLFNIIGYKKHCMAHYKPVYRLMEKYAKHGANIEVLDNGSLSSTACVTIHAKNGHIEAVLRRRERGVPRDLQEFEDEAAQLPDVDGGRPDFRRELTNAGLIEYIASLKLKLDMIIRPALLPSLAIVAIAVLVGMLYSNSASEPA